MHLVIFFLEYSAVENQRCSPFLAVQLNLGHFFINFFSYYPPMQKKQVLAFMKGRKQSEKLRRESIF